MTFLDALMLEPTNIIEPVVVARAGAATRWVLVSASQPLRQSRHLDR
jgi:hypothetical protein